jgi:hypothetical protein
MKQVNPVDAGVSLSLKALFDKMLVEISTAVPPSDSWKCSLCDASLYPMKVVNEKHRKI